MDEVQTALAEAASRFKTIAAVSSRGDSVIQQFYENSVVFVTGGSGFMGKLLVEKLLRVTNVNKIYILLRAKKGKTILQRFNDMKKDHIFDYLRKTKPNFEDKIITVDGDVASLRLGICDQDWRILTEEVDTIFHLAATTRFDEPLSKSTLVNTRGTREALRLAKECFKFRVFVHVSTAYCHATTDKIGVEIKEEFYSCPVPPDTLINLAETLDAKRMEAITPQLTEGWPNTYTFTKSVAEELVRSMTDELPICIIRPPIVVSSYCEPETGWLDMSCVYGPSGNMLVVILGIKQVHWTKVDAMLCLMPGDYVNNTILAAAWDCVEKREPGDKDIKIYTISSTKSDVRFATFLRNMMKEQPRKYATSKAIWYCNGIAFESKLVYRVFSWFLHYIPAFIVDSCIYLFNISKPKGLKSFVQIYKKIDKLEETYDYFSNNSWRFDDKNVVALHDKMSPSDQTIFNVDVTTINWDHMVYNWALGVKKYIVKDDKLKDDYAIKKQKIFKVANYFIVLAYFCLFYYIFSLIYSFFQ